MQTPTGTRAIVRGVPNTFDRAIRPHVAREAIDVALAKTQHRAYVKALEDVGLETIRLDPNDRYPDCCYVEDTAVVIGSIAIIAAMAAVSRRGETDAVQRVLRDYKQIRHLEPPARLDGGDVLVIGRRLFVGLSQRTNRAAAAQLSTILTGDGYEVTPLQVTGVLHLKSACTYLGEDLVVYRPGHFDESALSAYRKISVSAQEAHAANCLSINGRVLVPEEALRTRERIERAGFVTLGIDISESRKAAGGLTCSSIIL